MKQLLFLFVLAMIGQARADSKIEHVNSGKCLGFESSLSKPPNNSKAVMVNCTDAPRFRYNKDDYHFQQVDADICLDGYRSPVVAYRCGDYLGDQQWLPTHVHGESDDTFIFSNAGNEGQLNGPRLKYFKLETGDVRRNAKWFIFPSDELL